MKIPNPDAEGSHVLAAIEARYLSVSDLRTLLGIHEDNPIWLHLGDESCAWRLSLSDDAGLCVDVGFRTRSEAESGSAFRVLETRFSHA